MKYYKMDDLLCAIDLTHMYFHFEDNKVLPKMCLIKQNLAQFDIISMHPEVSKSEFEQSLPTSTAQECIYTFAYRSACERDLVMCN